MTEAATSLVIQVDSSTQDQRSGNSLYNIIAGFCGPLLLILPRITLLSDLECRVAKGRVGAVPHDDCHVDRTNHTWDLPTSQ